jgi:hypothetical protein
MPPCRVTVIFSVVAHSTSITVYCWIAPLRLSLVQKYLLLFILFIFYMVQWIDPNFHNMLLKTTSPKIKANTLSHTPIPSDVFSVRHLFELRFDHNLSGFHQPWISHCCPLSLYNAHKVLFVLQLTVAIYPPDILLHCSICFFFSIKPQKIRYYSIRNYLFWIKALFAIALIILRDPSYMISLWWWSDFQVPLTLHYISRFPFKLAHRAFLILLALLKFDRNYPRNHWARVCLPQLPSKLIVFWWYQIFNFLLCSQTYWNWTLVQFSRPSLIFSPIPLFP